MRFQPTVDVEPIDGHPALKMTWQHEVRDKDVEVAFRDIMQVLDTSEKPVYVVVDLLSNPHFPLMVTIQEALAPYRHPRLKAWLIVGSNWMARTIEGTLAKLTRKKNVYWFNTEAEALAYLKDIAVTHPD